MTVTRCSTICRCQRMIHSASRRSVSMVAVMAMLVVAMLIFWSHLRYPYRMPRRFVDYSHSTRHSRQNDVSRVLSRADQNSTPTMYDVSRPFDDADFQCIRTITSPSVTVCLFDVWHDVFISRSLQSAGIWEPYIVNEFIEAVKRTDVTAGVRLLEFRHEAVCGVARKGVGLKKIHVLSMTNVSSSLPTFFQTSSMFDCFSAKCFAATRFPC